MFLSINYKIILKTFYMVLLYISFVIYINYNNYENNQYILLILHIFFSDIVYL